MGFRDGVDPLCELQLIICDLGHVILDRSRGYEIFIYDISICVSDHKEAIYEGTSKSFRTFIFSRETVRAGGSSHWSCLRVSCD
jgi:hypothetical protein